MERVNAHIVDQVVHHVEDIPTAVVPVGFAPLVCQRGVGAKPWEHVFSQELRTHDRAGLEPQIIRMEDRADLRVHYGLAVQIVDLLPPALEDRFHKVRLVN